MLHTPRRIIIHHNKESFNADIINNYFYRFKNAGIKHFDLFFPDGSTPPRHVLTEFLQISEREGGAIAIHCKVNNSQIYYFFIMKNIIDSSKISYCFHPKSRC